MTELQELKERYKALNPSGKYPSPKMKETDILAKIAEWQSEPPVVTATEVKEEVKAVTVQESEKSIFIQNVFHNGVYNKSGDTADFDSATMEDFKSNKFIN
jgi:hypothetical protein